MFVEATLNLQGSRWNTLPRGITIYSLRYIWSDLVKITGFIYSLLLFFISCLTTVFQRVCIEQPSILDVQLL